MQSILGALSYYEKALGSGSKESFRQLDSALRRYLMTGWGFPKPPQRATQADLEFRKQVLAQLPIEKLYDWEVALEKGFDVLERNEKQRTPARSHIRKFVSWCIEKRILVDPNCHVETLKKTPLFNRKKRPHSRRRPCDLSTYALSETALPPALKRDLENFADYLTAPHYAGRIKGEVRETTSAGHRKILRGLLGWRHHHCQVPLAELSLGSLVPAIDLSDTNAAKAAAQDFRGLMEDLWGFLQGRGNSAGTMKKKLQVLTRLIQFQHLDQYVDIHGNDIPVMRVARELITRYEGYSRDELDPIPVEAKWLELENFIQIVTLPSFALTEFKTRHKGLRSQSAIMSSFQESILLSLFSLMPPRRPGEWRTCKLALHCELADKPKDLQPGDWIWPLPQERFAKAEQRYGYLTRQYIYQDPVTGEKFGRYLGTEPPAGRYLERLPLWFKDTPRQAAKSGDSHGYQKALIMDRQVYRDKRLYDFLEAYVMGYWRDRHGNWLSLGQCLKRPHSGFQFFPLRSAVAVDSVKPLETAEGMRVLPGWLFVGPMKGKMYREGDFGGKVARAAYRLSERFVTPHLMRSIYAVYAMETIGDRATMGSLAEAMGHKLATLEKVYDKRRSERKTRLIEVALEPQLDRICAGLPIPVTMPTKEPMTDLETLRAAINQLPPHQRQLLVGAL